MKNYISIYVFASYYTYYCIAQSLQWSFQSFLQVPEAGDNYGVSPSEIVGRGFETLVSGYDEGFDGVVNSNGTVVQQPRKPGIYIHTTDMGNSGRGYFVWSQQAKLIARDARAGDKFGKWMVFDKNFTIVVSSPFAQNQRGFVYVFNGTLRHWSQMQKLAPADIGGGGFFGEYISLHQNRMVIGARGVLGYTGAAYVYERDQGGVFWSRHSKLIARDIGANSNFAAKLALYGDTTVITASNDENPGLQTGSAYVFRGTSGLWSQQQKLIAIEMQLYKSGETRNLDVSLGSRFLGRTVSINADNIALGVTNNDPDKKNRDTVYIYQGYSSTNRWSLQQKLFSKNDSTTQLAYGADVYMDHNNTLIATVPGALAANSYIFKTFGNGCDSKAHNYSSRSLQQALNVLSAAELPPYLSDATVSDLRSLTDFQTLGASGGNLLSGGLRNVQVRSQFHNGSCLVIWMSDHFKDGWDRAVLTVRAPDLTNDTFHPHCDQVHPFQVRYCPYQPQDEGVYIIKVFAPTKARFSWEISWRVQEEATGNWYLGDASSKMHFQYNWNDSSFLLVHSENLVDLSEPCYRCTTISTTSWTDLQLTGNNAFWPLVVTGAPYYISDAEGMLVYASGKVCQDMKTFECYQSTNSGVYILRLGGGLFGDLLGFPQQGATWRGCGVNGTDRHQLIFQIKDSKCVALQVFEYVDRCDHPPDEYSTTLQPTFGGSAAPRSSTFGNIYQKDKMYSIEVPVQGQELDSEAGPESDAGDGEMKDKDVDSFLFP